MPGDTDGKVQWQVAPATVAVPWLVQNVRDAPPVENVQHSLLLGSEQSLGSWQSCTVVVSLQVVPMCVWHAAADEQDVPSDFGVHEGKLPLPLGTSTPQQIGVEPPHSSGPSQAILSDAGHVEGTTQT